MMGLPDLEFRDDLLMVGFSALSAIIAIISIFADRARQRRRDAARTGRDFDRVGFMPWPLITVIAMLMTLIFAAFAIKLS